MADSKITALTAITTVNPATYPLVIVDTSDTSMAITGTTKKVTTNQLLGSGGTATLASATITGDLTVATNRLAVSVSGVGIGTTTMTYNLNVTGAAPTVTGIKLINTSGTSSNLCMFSAGSAYSSFGVPNNAGWLAVEGSNPLAIGPTGNGGIVFVNNGSEAMRLNSTGLGVGVASPSYKLDVNGVINTSSDIYALGGRFALYRSAGSSYIDWSSGQSLIFRTVTSAGGAGASTIATIDASGNVGIGVTPSAWRAGARALQLGANKYASLHEQSSGAVNLCFAAYEGSANVFNYTTGDAASRYALINGQHQWYNAPSGTAGNAITWTQAMTLDASGNLLVGTTSAGGNRLNVQTASGDCTALIKSQAANVGVTIDYVSNYGNFNFSKSGTAKWSLGILNDSASTPTFKLFNDAAVGVYVTYGGTSWTATSDERLKDIIEPISNAVAKVGSLRSVIGKFKTDSEGTRRSFLIAQDVQSVLPEAVDASNPDKLGVAYSEVIPLLVAAIKELTARVQTLETR